MIPNKVKALFQFIDYLDGNKKKYIKTYIPLVKEIKELNQKIYALDLDESNYKNKQKADRYYNERLPKYTQLNIDVIQPILNKLKELGIWQGDEVFTSIYNANIKEIRELTEEFTDNDVKTIQQYNQKYIDFRTETNCCFLNLGMMFDYLDRVLKVLFDFFKDSTKNEFEAFEPEIIEINDLREIAEQNNKETLFKASFSLPLTSLTQQPKADYWQDDADERSLIYEYEKAVNKLIKGGDTGCLPMRFRMLPRVVLNENKYSTERKKYLLKQMRLVLDGVKNTEIGNELFTDLCQRVEPYEGIYDFVFGDSNTPPQQSEKPKPKQEIPKTFDELFYNPANAEPCLKILNEINPPVIDAMNNYIGKAKGIFPLWVNVLKNHKPKPLIKHFKNTIYKDLLNTKVKGLNLSKDASEFRKHYKRIENDKIELDIKTILSQYSQSGKLGK